MLGAHKKNAHLKWAFLLAEELPFFGCARRI